MIDVDRVRRLAVDDNINDIPAPGVARLAASLLRDALDDGHVFELPEPPPFVEVTPAKKAGPHPHEVYTVIFPVGGEPLIHVVATISPRSVWVFTFRPAPVEEDALDFLGAASFNPTAVDWQVGLPAVPAKFERAIADLAADSVEDVHRFLSVLNAVGTRRDEVRSAPRHGRQHQPRDGSHVLVSWSTPIAPHQHGEPHGGHHSSPRPHDRRAHDRRLPSGDVVPVRSTIVNRERGPIVPRDHYEVG